MQRRVVYFYYFVIVLFVFNTELLSVERTVGVIQNSDPAYEGYTLFSPMDSGDTYLIDNYGRTIHTWESQYRPNLSVYLTENGNLVKSIKTSDENYGVEIMTWDGEVIWEYFYTDDLYLQHHDIEPMPNGNILMVVRDIRLRATMEDAGRDPASISTARIWLEKIVEVEPTGFDTGSIVWEWRVYNHLVQDFDPGKANYGVVKDHPELLDVNYTPNALREWLHVNSVSYNEDLDQIIVNSRNLNEFWVVDHSTTLMESYGHTGGNSGKGGDILYRWGNPIIYDASGARKFYNQHDARWVETGSPGEGNITVFNNGEERPGGAYSTVDEIIPPVNESGQYTMPLPGNSYSPVDQTWTYTANPPESMYSMHISGAHRLQNGNTIMCQGYDSHFYEVRSDNSIVWEYISPFKTTGGMSAQGDTPTSSSIFRCHRYGSDYAAFNGRDITPKGYLEINPIIVEGTQHSPAKPTELENVIITSKIYDGSGINSVELYVYAGNDSLVISMNDNGIDSDEFAGDSTYTAVVPIFPGEYDVDYYIKIEDGSGEIFNDPPFASKDYTFSYNVIAARPTNITIKRETDQITLEWDVIQGVSSYKVYSSDDPFSSFSNDQTGLFNGNNWTTPITQQKKFYYIKAVGGGNTAKKK